MLALALSLSLSLLLPIQAQALSAVPTGGTQPNSAEPAAALVAPPAAPIDEPNILVLLLDDIGVDKVGAYGEHRGAGPTPFLDLIADHSVLFRHAWATPVCSPARATLLTGRHPFRHGVGNSMDPDDPPLADSEWTLAEALSEEGYRTAAIGKWHLAADDQPDPWRHAITWGGFERHLGSFKNIGDYSNWIRNDADSRGAVQEVTSTYATSQVVDDALEVIEEFGGDPWFVWVAFQAVHKPLHVPPAHLHSQKNPAGSVQKYRAMAEAMDTEIGRLLTSLRPGTLADTYVFVIGDNGTYAAAITPPFGVSGGSKGSVKEEGINVPWLVYGPDVEAGERSALVSIVDLFPTVMDLVGARQSDVEQDGQSLARLLRTNSQEPLREAVYTERFQPNGVGGEKSLRLRTARDHRYKLTIERYPGMELERRMYDLQEDPFEQASLLPVSQLTPDQKAAYDSLIAVIASMN
jgi:arylsulfatase A-like enzyme